MRHDDNKGSELAMAIVSTNNLIDRTFVLNVTAEIVYRKITMNNNKKKKNNRKCAYVTNSKTCRP